MNWADQQPGESRRAWKDRTFAMHYGMGASRLRDAFGGRMPQEGDTISVNLSDGFADSFTTTQEGNYDIRFGKQTSGRMPPPSADPEYSGRDDGYRSYGGRQWRAGEGESRTEQLLNTIEDWDQLGVELPKLIQVPTPNDEGIFVITRMEA